MFSVLVLAGLESGPAGEASESGQPSNELAVAPAVVALTEEEALQHCDFYCALCTKNHALLKGLLEVCPPSPHVVAHATYPKCYRSSTLEQSSFANDKRTGFGAVSGCHAETIGPNFVVAESNLPSVKPGDAAGLQVFAQVGDAARGALKKNAAGLGKTVGAGAAAMIALIRDHPAGSADLLLQMLYVLTGEALVKVQNYSRSFLVPK